MFALKESKLMNGPRLVHEDPFAERRELVSSIEAAQAHMTAILPDLIAAEKRATERVIAAENETKLAWLAVAETQAARRSAVFESERTINRAEAKLREIEPPELTELRNEFRAIERHLMAVEWQDTSSRDPEAVEAHAKRYRAHARRLAGVRKAIRDLDAAASIQVLDNVSDV